MTGRRARLLLGLAAVAVAVAAADTYVVVLLLPDMVSGVGGDVLELQKAAPIVSAFLLGYVAMLPLIGRIADLRGRLPVLLACLVLFALGSAVTALAYDLTTVVLGRFLQGVGGGGLVPATMALVADLYPMQRRGVPLGVVSAVQEVGSVLGPLFGAAVLAVASWRAVFGINLVVAVLLVLALRAAGRRSEQPRSEQPGPMPRRLPDPVSLVLLTVTLAAAVAVFVQPEAWRRDLVWGAAFVPLVGTGRWTTPLAVVAALGALGLAVRGMTARRPLVDPRPWAGALAEADVVGSLLVAVALGGVVLAFATADPRVEVFSASGRGYLVVSVLAAVAFAGYGRRATAPLVPRGALGRRPAWGAMVVSLFVGAALIAALVDVPVFARTTVHPASQLGAALVLLRLLVAVPVGAVIGGYLLRRLSAGVLTAAGMACAAVGFAAMSRWTSQALTTPSATVVLVVTGFGFGLALAPVNAAVLAHTDPQVHALASALVVVSRMVGMLVGISALTTLGLRRLYLEQADLPPVTQVCAGAGRCRAFDDLLREAALVQEQTVFLGAAGCAAMAAVAALTLLRTGRQIG